MGKAGRGGDGSCTGSTGDVRCGSREAATGAVFDSLVSKSVNLTIGRCTRVVPRGCDCYVPLTMMLAEPVKL